MRRILAVYGLKTRDYGYLARFYPAARLQEACENRSLALRFLFPEDVPAFLAAASARSTSASEYPLASLPARIDFPPEETVCLVRGRVPDATVKSLEAAGYRCVNSSGPAEIANDKLETARILARLSVPTPRTAGIETLEHAFKATDYPIIAKPRRGSRGEGVRLVPTAAEAHELANRSIPGDDGWVFQEYVGASKGRDIRVFFAGETIIAVVERSAPAGSLASNPSLGGETRPSRFGPTALAPWLAVTRTIARETGLWYGTVDFLFRSEPADAGCADDYALDLTVCEINAAPGFEALEKATGIDVAGTIIDCLIHSFP